MMVQSHRLAARAFSEEVAASIASGSLHAERVSEMTLGLNTCVKGLRELESNLFISTRA